MVSFFRFCLLSLEGLNLATQKRKMIVVNQTSQSLERFAEVPFSLFLLAVEL